MEIRFRPLERSDAHSISNWRYPPPYDFYDWRPGDDPAQLLDAISPCFAADDESERLIGFVCFGPAGQVPVEGHATLYAEPLLDIGLGLRPDLTGRGLGLAVVHAALDLGTALFRPPGFRLSVAAFNERARRVYARAGFELDQRFTRVRDGQSTPFVIMRRSAADWGGEADE